MKPASASPRRLVQGKVRILFVVALLACVVSAPAQPFRLPTVNRFIFDKGSEDKFFAPTAGKTWTSGCFGCVRTDGRQMHEGLDIRCIQRDRRGEPTDPVMSTAEGTIAYINAKPSLSNYGNYILLRHLINGLEIYSTYSHLGSIRPGLKAGQAVKADEVIPVIGASVVRTIPNAMATVIARATIPEVNI